MSENNSVVIGQTSAGEDIEGSKKRKRSEQCENSANKKQSIVNMETAAGAIASSSTAHTPDQVGQVVHGSTLSSKQGVSSTVVPPGQQQQQGRPALDNNQAVTTTNADLLAAIHGIETRLEAKISSLEEKITEAVRQAVLNELNIVKT